MTNSAWRSIGLQFTARYRFAKALDNVNPLLVTTSASSAAASPQICSRRSTGERLRPVNFDVRHRFIGSFIWEVPFKEPGCCGGNDGWLSWLRGGWSVTGIFQAMTGFPFDVFDCRGALAPETPCPRALIAPGVDLGDIRAVLAVPSRIRLFPTGLISSAQGTSL